MFKAICMTRKRTVKKSKVTTCLNYQFYISADRHVNDTYEVVHRFTNTLAGVLPRTTKHWCMPRCARVAHCVTARWRNFSHYCRPLRQYDVWFTFSEHKEALSGAPTTHGVHNKNLLCKGEVHSSPLNKYGASLSHSSGWGTWSVSPHYRDLRTRGVCASTDNWL